MKSFTCGILCMIVMGCQVKVAKNEVPSRQVIMHQCWQTFDLGLKDKSDFVKNSTVLTLGRIGTPKAIQTLRAVEATTTPSVIRTYTSVLASLHDSLAFVSLADYRKSTDFQVRENVIVGLTRMADLYERESMMKMFDRMMVGVDTMQTDSFSYDKEEILRGKDELRAKIAVAMAKLGDASRLAMVEPVLRRKDFSAKVNLLYVISRLEAREAESVAFRLSTDGSAYVRAKAAEALAAIGSASALRQILAREKNDEVRVAAAIGLMKVDERAAVSVLRPALTTPDDDLQYKILLALAEVKSSELRADLIPMMHDLAKDAGEWALIGVLNALGSYRDTTSMELLEAGLSDNRLQVREMAIGVLTSFRPRDMIDELTEYARDEQYSVRSVAISGLGKIEDRRLLDETVIPILFERMRNDSEMMVRVRAAFTLLDVLNDRLFTRRAKEVAS